MKLNNWDIVLDSNEEGYTISKTDDGIVIVTYLGHTIVTIHLNNGQPTFVTSEAIIKVDMDNKRIIVCSSNDGINRFNG